LEYQQELAEKQANTQVVEDIPEEKGQSEEQPKTHLTQHEVQEQLKKLRAELIVAEKVVAPKRKMGVKAKPPVNTKEKRKGMRVGAYSGAKGAVKPKTPFGQEYVDKDGKKKFKGTVFETSAIFKDFVYKTLVIQTINPIKIIPTSQ